MTFYVGSLNGLVMHDSYALSQQLNKLKLTTSTTKNMNSIFYIYIYNLYYIFFLLQTAPDGIFYCNSTLIVSQCFYEIKFEIKKN